VASVASFFVSRLDTLLDPTLPQGLQGTLAVANARAAYRRFRETFSGPRWEALARRGARVQRPLWASTSTKDPRYSDVLYVEGLVAPDTVNTLPPQTLRAFRDHGRARALGDAELDEAQRILTEAGRLGIDLEEAGQRLQEDGVAAFAASWRRLRATLEAKVRSVAQEAGGRAR
jgi:transaldolase